MFAPAVADPRYRAKRQRSTPYNLPAPTGGLNARDAYTDMDEHDAVALVNVFPEANYCAVRKGYAAWASGMPGPIRSLLTWYGNLGVDLQFAGSGTSLWDVSASGAATESVAGLTNVDFQWTNLENAAGQHLIAVNGADDMRAFDGSAWSTPVVTGASSDTFTNVCQYKERLWFATANSLDLYYLELQAIAGPASLFPLGAVCRRGGYVMGIGTYSNDSGDGPDDYLAIVTSNGEVVVYEGTDPTSATTWSLVGRFDVGFPIGRRCCLRWNGDLAILTQDGVVSMRAAQQFSRESIQKASITGKIQTLFSQYAQSYKANFGWMLTTFPKTRYLIVNVPEIEGSQQTQLVMNTITGSWCRFENMNAGCWGVANDLLYFGGDDGVVYQADNGYLDAEGVIEWEMQTAWQMPGGPSNKFFSMVRPTMLVGAGVTFAIGVNVDFSNTQPTGFLPAIQPDGSPMVWPWTWPGLWGGSTILDTRWQSAGAIGTWASMHLLGTVNGGGCQVNAFDVIAEKGGPL